jgi:AcrR family transcriptional regulator
MGKLPQAAPPVPTKMPRPALTRSRIVAAGVVIVSELGLPALSLRSVARRVNTTATGVQRQIGETELVQSVVAEIVQSMPPVPANGDWSRRLRQWAVQTRGWLSGYPGLARYLLADGGFITAEPDRLEAIVRVLEETDLTYTQRVMAANVLSRFVVSSTDLDEPIEVLGGEPSTRGITASKTQRPALPTPRARTRSTGADARFAFGLDLLLEGIGCRAGNGLLRPSAMASLTRSSVRI